MLFDDGASVQPGIWSYQVKHHVSLRLLFVPMIQGAMATLGLGEGHVLF